MTLTGDGNRLVVQDRHQMHDLTTFGDVMHKFKSGPRQAALEHSGYLNAAAARCAPSPTATSAVWTWG